MNKMILIALLGDIMLGRGVNELIPNHSPESFWGTTLPILRSSDFVLGNLECAITSHQVPWSKTHKVFHFRADPPAVTILKAGNIKAVNLANNHSLDFEERGLLDTLDLLDKADIKHTGAGRNLADARSPAIITVKGLKLAILSATDNEPPFAAEENKPGVNYLEFDQSSKTLNHLQENIREAKEMGAEFIILSLHWGPNMVLTPTKPFIQFAHKAIEMGVDVIHGHSAHLFQGIEFYQKGVIFYNTGDFLDDYSIDPILRNDWSFIFMLELEGKRVKKVKAVPVQLAYGQTNLANDRVANEMITRMKSLSLPFGTKVEKEGDIVVFTPPEL